VIHDNIGKTLESIYVIVRLCLTLNQGTLIPTFLRLITLNFYLRILVSIVINKQPNYSFNLK